MISGSWPVAFAMVILIVMGFLHKTDRHIWLILAFICMIILADS